MPSPAPPTSPRANAPSYPSLFHHPLDCLFLVYPKHNILSSASSVTQKKNGFEKAGFSPPKTAPDKTYLKSSRRVYIAFHRHEHFAGNDNSLPLEVCPMSRRKQHLRIERDGKAVPRLRYMLPALLTQVEKVRRRLLPVKRHVLRC